MMLKQQADIIRYKHHINNNDYDFITIDQDQRDPGYAPMIPLAENIDAEYITNTGDLIVSFSCDSPIINNGYIWVYDENKKYLGISDHFKDDEGNIPFSLNEGTEFYTEGTSNTFVIKEGDLSKNTKNSQVKFICVALTDGKQYFEDSFDARSESARTPVIGIELVTNY